MKIDTHVINTLFNERSIDLHIRNKYGIKIQGMPNFKILKLVDLRNKYLRIWKLLLFCAYFLVFFKVIGQWGLSMLVSFFPYKINEDEIFAYITVDSNKEILEKSVLQDCDSNFNYLLNSSILLSRALGTRAITKLIIKNITLFKTIFLMKKEIRNDLLLHSINSFEMLLFSKFIITNKGLKFVTDDHYQRWAYTLSILSKSFSIVQHGKLDASIEFFSKFKNVSSVYVWDKKYEEKFLSYINVNKFYKADISRDLLQTKYGSECVLIASSAPHIIDEISFVKTFKKLSSMPLLVKLHPVHQYDSNKSILLQSSDFICSKDDFPNCKLFISHSSALEDTYLKAGINILRISEYNSISAAVDESLKILDSK